MSFLILSLSYIIVSLFYCQVSCLLCLLLSSSLTKLLSCVSGVSFVVLSCSALQLGHIYSSDHLMLSFSPSSVLLLSLSVPLMKVFIFSVSVSCSSVLSFMISFLSNISWTVSPTSVSTFGSVQSSF